MDPVDNAGRGVAALPSITVPVAMTWSEPSACNANGSAEVVYAGARGIRRGIKIVGANHSDPQDPAGFLSILACGAPDAARQAFLLDKSTNLPAWVESEIPGVGIAPQSVTNLPPTGRLFLRSRSMSSEF